MNRWNQFGWRIKFFFLRIKGTLMLWFYTGIELGKAHRAVKRLDEKTDKLYKQKPTEREARWKSSILYQKFLKDLGLR